MRRHWSGFTLKSKFTQHKFHYTCNLALHKTLWRIQSSFLFFFNGDQKTSASRQGHWPLHRCTALFGLSTVSGHSKLRELVSMTNGNVVNLWHYDKFLHHLEQQAPLANLTTRLLRLRSCLILGFHLASLRVHFSIRALTSIPRFIISF